MDIAGALTADDLMDIEGDVDALLRDAKEPDDVAPVLERVCEHITGCGPQLARMRDEGRARYEYGCWRVQLRMDVLGTPRGRFVMGHEIAHVYAAKRLRRVVSEEWCDTFGALIAAPRRAVMRAIRVLGHRPSLLSQALLVEPELALLRVGETTDRSVLLERRRGVLLHRGEDFEWPPRIAWARVDRGQLHMVRVGDRVGLMAARSTLIAC